jgi:hypothetical protein
MQRREVHLLRFLDWLPFASRTKAKFATLVIAIVFGSCRVAAKNVQISLRYSVLSAARLFSPRRWTKAACSNTLSPANQHLAPAFNKLLPLGGQTSLAQAW